MNIYNFRTINSGYIDLVKILLTNPTYHQKVDFDGCGKGKYINKKSRSHLRNVHILFENPGEFDKFQVHCPKRSDIMNDYMNKERKFFDAGITDSNKMGEISKIWKFIENPDQTINANYGYMVYHIKDAGNTKYGNELLSQYSWCQKVLKNNLYSLQAVMHFHRPKDQYEGNLDQPCTVFTQFTVEDNKLNFHSFMRSNDIIYGTPYNLAYFKLLQERMRHYLNSELSIELEMGYLHHNVTSLHLYDDKKYIAEKITGL